MRNLFTLTRRSMLASGAVASVLGTLSAAAQALGPYKGPRMPVLFIGHGSPLNAMRDNAFTRVLQKTGKELPRPRAILVVSAHWLTEGATGVTIESKPKTIHDFGGFPRELHEMQYPAPGHPELAELAARAVKSGRGVPTNTWGLDHGAWTVLKHLFPQADVPVFQVSIDYSKAGDFHLSVGKELSVLRDQGVLILGSGNVVHNLGALDRGAPDNIAASREWAQGFDDVVKTVLNSRDHAALSNYLVLSKGAKMAVPTPDHYWPLLYAAGASSEGESANHFFEEFHSGTLSMRCVRWG